MFEEPSKGRGVFRTQARIYEGYLTAYYFSSQMLDWLMQASQNIEIFKVKLRCNKSSRLLQRVAFLGIFVISAFHVLYFLKFNKGLFLAPKVFILCKKAQWPRGPGAMNFDISTLHCNFLIQPNKVYLKQWKKTECF